jgi:pyruvate dehydrogenase E2 component (dihydrolipoamide acetyltransferase)
LVTRTEILIPDIGDFTDVDVIEVLVAPGDQVEKEQGILTLETDKATMDIPSPFSGNILEILVSPGDKVSMGDLAAVIEIGKDEVVVAMPREVSAQSSPDESPVQAGGAADGDREQSAAIQERAPEPVLLPVTVPDIGDFRDVDVIEVLVAPGDRVEKEQGLVTLETDKATMDVPSPGSGTVESVQVVVGDKVSLGDPVLVLKLMEKIASPVAGVTSRAPVVPAAQVSAPEVRQPRARPPVAKSVDETGFALAHAGPSVRKFAREVGVDLIRVKGSGRKGRITHQDVKEYIKGRLSETPAQGAPALPRVPEVDFARFGPVEIRPLGRIRKISGPRLQASWLNIPHVTQHDDADITDMETMRKALKDSAAAKGIRVTPLAFLMRACAMALQEFPQFNTSLDSSGENLVCKQYINIGFAADTENGLVVPVVRDADKKDLFELAHELSDLSAAAREGKLTAAQMQGGCFTISSLGGIGGTAFTPIVNAPEVAILGVSRSRMAPVYDGKAFVPRLMLPLSLSYDHRVIDGADAARFTTYLAQALADVSRLIQAIP